MLPLFPLDFLISRAIITTIQNKDVEEDEYTFQRRHREQGMVRTCARGNVEWTSESQGERKPVTRAGAATVIQAKGIAFGPYPHRVKLAFSPLRYTAGIFV
mgnify:FL=1